MRILVVGAGAIGGYFGGRLLQAGNDVTFLVRPKRAAELASAGLVIKSPNGDVTLKNPPTVQADKLTEKFDVVLLSCKAFDLDDAIKSFAPAVGPQTSIIPLLNGMLHLDVLDAEIRPRARARRPLRDRRDAEREARGGAAAADAVAQFRRTRRQDVGSRPRHRGSHDQRQFRRGRQREHHAGDVGEVGVPRHARGLDLPDARRPSAISWPRPAAGISCSACSTRCSAIATAAGHAPTGPFFERTKGMLTAEGSQMTASMFRDIKAGAPVEADHVIGDLIARADAAKVPVPKLRIAYTHLKAYEKQRG